MKLQMTCKWGFDGATAQSIYKQGGTSAEADNQVLFTSMVPLQLVEVNSDASRVVRSNRTPSSGRFARPLKLEYARETAELSKAELAYWNGQIGALKSHTVNLGDIVIEVSFELLLTMIDGKVQTAITDTSSPAVCNVCNATPKQFNDLEQVRSRAIREDSLMLGLSTMHSWIRFYEFILSVAYKLQVRKWSHLTRAPLGGGGRFCPPREYSR